MREEPQGSLRHVINAGVQRYGSESIGMKICDLCKKVTPKLNPVADDPGTIEVCDACYQNLLARLGSVNRQVAETQVKLRAEAMSAWKRERSVADSAT